MEEQTGRVQGMRWRGLSQGLSLRWGLFLALFGSWAVSAYPEGYSELFLDPEPLPIPCTQETPCSYSPDAHWSARLALSGGASQSSLRFAVADFDQDGVEDVAVSAGGQKVQVLFGRLEGFTGELETPDAPLLTLEAPGGLGTGLAAGDVTGDGVPDLLMGAPDDQQYLGISRWKGSVYVLPGQVAERWAQTETLSEQPNLIRLIYSVDLNDLNALYNGLGFSLAVGDLGVASGCGGSTPGSSCGAGDGTADLVIGAPESGVVLVVYGPLSSEPTARYLDLRGASNTVELKGSSAERTGHAVAVVDSLDGTNAQTLADLAIGAPLASNGQGQVVVLAGRNRDTFLQQLGGSSQGLLSDSGLTSRRTVTGDAIWRGDGGSIPAGQLGTTLGCLGDLDRDGYQDLAVGAPTAPFTQVYGKEAGNLYLFFGGSQAIRNEAVALSSAGWIRLSGGTTASGGHLGLTPASAGALLRRGAEGTYPDLLVGAPDLTINGLNQAGGAWILSGRARDGWNAITSELELSSQTSRISGASGSLHVGSGTASVDLNRDGQNELLVGAFELQSSSATQLYLYSAQDFEDQDGDGQSRAEGDCDESAMQVYYSTAGDHERCDGLDNDCDGRVDDEDSSLAQPSYYADQDKDGYGDPTQQGYCTAGADRVSNGLDCNDNNAQIAPGVPEQCDELDNDCDGFIDDADTSGASAFPSWYLDTDQDGWGSDCLEPGVSGCVRPYNYGATNQDCFDTIYCTNPYGDLDPATIHPEATEVCDGLDNDCNQLVDGEDAGLDDPENVTVSYPDEDEDGYGGAAETTCGSEIPPGNLLEGGDCNDLKADVNPSAQEQCNFLDDDCDGGTDEALPTAPTYTDSDRDGYGIGDVPFGESCAYEGASWVGGDCLDSDPSVHPGAVETCNRVDDDCDNLLDADDVEGLSDVPVLYMDDDRDGFGASETAGLSCTASEGWAEEGGDCDDTDSKVSPVAVEVCNAGVDDDCDGAADDTDDDVVGQSSAFLDSDQDGYGGTTSVLVCALGPGLAILSDDCDDSNADIHPGASEQGFNAVDEDCDGLAPLIGCACTQLQAESAGSPSTIGLLALGLWNLRASVRSGRRRRSGADRG